MQIGVCRPVRSLDDVVPWVHLAEDIGAALIGFGDSQTMWPDPYVALTLAAEHTSRALLGPVVTVPRTRHPTVSASAIGSIQHLSGGRAFYAIGPGDSAIYAIGEPRVSMRELEDYALCVRDLCHREPASFQDRELRLRWPVPTVPLWVAGDGPRMLELAGRIADGVVVGSAATTELVTFARQHIAAGAASAGRSIDDLDIWYLVPVHVAPSREEGIARLRFYLASYAKVRFRYGMHDKGALISPDLERRLYAFLAEFDHTQQFRVGSSATDDLLEKYDLTEWLAGQRLVTGTVEDILTHLEQLFRAGATNIFCPQMLPDVMASTEALRPVIAGASAIA
jgi:5,10-methylenetetrahydromethanopterin reductase